MDWFADMSGPWHLINDIPVIDIEFIPEVVGTGVWCESCLLPSALTVHMHAFTPVGILGTPFIATICTNPHQVKAARS